MSPKRRRSGPRLVLSRALLLLLLVGGSLLATEAILRWKSPPHDGYSLYPPDLDYVFDPAPGVMPGISEPSRFRSNSDGLRADELSDDDRARVLCIGGSTTACIFLDQDETWTAILQRLLGERSGLATWVGNAGKDGMTSRDHVVQLETILPRVPDVDLVLVLAGVNDLLLRLSQGRAYDPDAMSRPATREALLVHAFSVRPDAGRSAFEDLRLVQLVRSLVRPAVVQGRLMDPQGDWYVSRRRQRARARILPELPDLSTSLDEFARNLGTLADFAAARGTRLVLVTQPSLWRDDLSPELSALLWLGGRGDFMNTDVEEYYAVDALLGGLEAYNEVTRRVAAARGLPCIDLAVDLPKDLSVFYDDVHFNEAGAALVAERLADALLTLEPFAR